MASPSCWTCELSGEPLNTATDEVVVTPSGHVCLKRLMLTKLSENGGTDPFVDSHHPPARPLSLSEDQLITLQVRSKIIPPRPQVTSMPALLGLVGKEYEALVLELFDARRALEDTRKELSHALYQNDAAVRVVARLSMERDAARQELAQWKAVQQQQQQQQQDSVVQEEQQQPDEGEPPAKRAKTANDRGGIPQDDLELMTATWETLAKERKQKKKSVVALPRETLKDFREVDKKSWHKTRNKAGIVDMKCAANHIVTAGRDKQLVVYSLERKQLVHTIGTGVVVSCVDINAAERIVAAKPDGQIVQYVDGTAVGEPIELDGNAVDVALHPTGKHIVVTAENGSIVFCGIRESGMEVICTFSAPEETTYSSGVLHPDGLISAAGMSTGAIHLWDFKNQTLADTLEVSWERIM